MRFFQNPRILLLIAPFYLNDFGFWALQSNPLAFYLLDYACRVFVLVVLAVGVSTQVWPLDALGLRKLPWRTFAFASAGLTGAGLLIQLSDAPLQRLLGWSAIFQFPDPNSRALKLFDQSLGIALVALSEELVFRGAILYELLKTPGPRMRAIAISTALFATMHWGAGLNNVISAWLWCLLPTLATLLTRSIWPAVVAHFVTDFVAFW